MLCEAYATRWMLHRFLDKTATSLGWSARSFHRVLRVARTVADLAGAGTIGRLTGRLRTLFKDFF